mmetsp:Transcript_29848/g.79400  ORF Transcript_29848/g.79400 Transcript_29848/m.79400 type:complete len:100 (+) Transcript_29848:458-757(+)
MWQQPLLQQCQQQRQQQEWCVHCWSWWGINAAAGVSSARRGEAWHTPHMPWMPATCSVHVDILLAAGMHVSTLEAAAVVVHGASARTLRKRTASCVPLM